MLCSTMSYSYVQLLSPPPAFYTRFGWELWPGLLFEQQPGGETIPSPAKKAVIILQRRGGPQLDLDSSLTAPWRPGEIW